MRNFLSIMLLQFPMILLAQDTLFFDADWKASSREEHAYYRLMPMKRIGPLVFIQDFYKNGNVQMQGYALADDTDSYVGDAYWYDENGYDFSTQQSLNRTDVHELTYYHKDGTVWKKIDYAADGRIKKIRTYLHNNELTTGEVKTPHGYSGVFSVMKPDRYYEQPADEAPLLEEVEAVPDVTVDPTRHPTAEAPGYKEVIYWRNGQLAMEQVLDGDEQPIASRYWDKTGKLLSEVKADHSGTRFSYFTSNGFAAAVSLKEETTAGEQHRRVQTAYRPDGEPLHKSTFVDGQISEIVHYTEGKEVAVQQYRDGEPYDGEFVVNLGDKETLFTMLRGERIGKIFSREIGTGTIFASGVYKDGKPVAGTFYDTEDVYKWLSYANGLQEGVQKIFADYEGKVIGEEYEMKAGLRDGYRKIYRDGHPPFESVYKADTIVSGTIVEGYTQLTYAQGSLTRKVIGNAYEPDSISAVEDYMDNRQTRVAYYDFTIEENPQDVYHGVYKDGEPYEGYFKLETLVDNIPLISVFEKGVLRYVYSFELLEQMDSYRHYTYNQKTSYENGQVSDGPTYALIGRERLITSYYKSGKMCAFDVNLFAMHYFNRLSLRLEKGVIVISEMSGPLEVKAYAEGNNIVAELSREGEVLERSWLSPVIDEATPNSITQYYLEDDQVKSIVTTQDSLSEVREELDLDNSLLYKVFALFPVREFADIDRVFQRLYTNFTQEDFDTVFETALDTAYPVTVTNYLGDLYYDQDGKAQYGLRFTALSDKRVRVEAIANGRVIASKVFASLHALLENDREAIRTLESKILNEY